MAEVAGTIVGVISLSLQLYDKLSEYRNGVKNAKKKGEQITRELDTLVNLSKASAAVDENPSHLYLLMTRMGWVRGCQILLDAGYSYTPEGRHHLPLLIEAIDSKNPSMVQFWLNTRENAAVEGLAYIGRLEYAVVYALRVSEANIGKLLVTHLVEQRRQLRQMIGSSGIECECVRTPEVVLDAHATCAMDVLDEHNLKVPHFLRPTSGSIYHNTDIYHWNPHPRYDVVLTTTLEILQFLYDAGFKDIAGNDIKCSKNVPWSPFHFGIVSYKGPDHGPNSLAQLFQIVDWFLRQGASMTDCFPQSNITALHCVSAKAANIIFSCNATAALSIPDDTWNRITSGFQHKLTDGCKCRCSTHGCTSITSFCNHAQGYHTTTWQPMWQRALEILRLEHLDPKDRNKYRRIRKTVQCIAEAAKDSAHRWVITEFIRLCVFSWLGIQHVCCGLDEIMNPFHQPDFSRPPPPRYPPDELHRIQEEDAVLVTVLEELVPSFDARYDAHESDLQSFINDVVTPEINIVLDQLKQEDEAANAAGRREMGVVMIEESKNSVIEECESDSLDECESDVVDECESDAYEED